MEMVYVGNRRLIGEVIGLTDEETTIQVYESTSGLQTGEPVEPTGAPMSVTLGPGILTNIFDGIERPLRALEDASGAFIGDGLDVPILDNEKEYDVSIKVKVGTMMQGGEAYASCPETSAILHLCFTLMCEIRLSQGPAQTWHIGAQSRPSFSTDIQELQGGCP